MPLGDLLATDAILPALTPLIEAVKDNPTEKQLVEQTKALVEHQIGVNGELIRLRNAGDSAGVAALVGQEDREATAAITANLSKAVAEERRLLYVGITRARRTLAMSWCRNRIKYGSAMPCMASSFIKELPPEWIDHRNATQILSAPVSEAAAKSKFGALKAMLERVNG